MRHEDAGEAFKRTTKVQRPSLARKTPATVDAFWRQNSGQRFGDAGLVLLQGDMKPGPAAPHALSLWNFSLSPGWTGDEVHRLRLCLMVHGVGRWSQIVQSGYLVGKTISQLNLQTQKLLGQQSLAEFTGLQIDPAEVFLVNREKIKAGAKTKMGLVINEGPNPSREVVVARLRENRARFALPETRVREAEFELRLLSREQQWQDVHTLLQSLPEVQQQRLHQLLAGEWLQLQAATSPSTTRHWVQLESLGHIVLPGFAERRQMSAEDWRAYQQQLESMCDAVQRVQHRITHDKENWLCADASTTEQGLEGSEAPEPKRKRTVGAKRARGAPVSQGEDV